MPRNTASYSTSKAPEGHLGADLATDAKLDPYLCMISWRFSSTSF